MRQEQSSWFVIHTKPRQEGIALKNLEQQDFQCFLPMALNPYQKKSQKELRIEPLFPRYLFLKAIPNQQSLAPVRSTRGVSTLVSFGKKLATLTDTAINAILIRRDAESGLVKLDPTPAKVGDRVKVFDGPFAGLQGVFKERKGENRAVLLMSMLGTESAVEVDALLLKKQSCS